MRVNVMFLVTTAAAAATGGLALLGRLSFELRARAALRAVRARGERVEIDELRRRVLESR